MKKSSRPVSIPKEHQTQKKNDKLEKVAEANEPRQPSPSIYGITRAQTASRIIKQRSSTLMIQKGKRGDWGEFDLAHAWSPEDRFSHGRASQSTVHGERHGRESCTSTDSIHVIRPHAMEPIKAFKAIKVRDIIQEVFESHLAGKTYDPVFCKTACRELADIIKGKVKRLRYWRYKIVSHVIMGDIHQQDIRVVSRCAWSPDVDSFAEYLYGNFSLYAIGLVYGIYCE